MSDAARREPDRELTDRLRLMVLTDPTPTCRRPLLEVVAECVEAGATAIQLRDKTASAAELYETARRLSPIVRAGNALLIVNDRFDVALASGADGVHLGPDDLPVTSVRSAAPGDFVIGASTDDPERGRRLAAEGADYLGIGAVFGTRSKPGLENEAIGPDRVGEVISAAGIPGVGIGGITSDHAEEVLRTGAGIAVLGAVMHAADPARAVRELRSIMEAVC